MKKVSVQCIKGGRVEVLFRCHTIEEAEAFIAGCERFDKANVHAGYYGIDAPEVIACAADPNEHLRRIARELREMGIGRNVDVNGGDAVDYLNLLRNRLRRAFSKEV